MRHEDGDGRMVVLAALALLVVLGSLLEVAHRPITVEPGMADGGVAEPLGGYMVQAADASVPGIARPMPKKPLAGQKRAPCEGDEMAHIGACWVEMKREPENDQCGTKGYELNGRCYMAVSPARKPDLSVGQ